MDFPITFIIAVVLLGLVPGPNVGLIVGMSLSEGRRTGLLAVAGTNFGLAVQLFIFSIVTTALIEGIADFLWLIRWGGVGYLCLLGTLAFRQGRNLSRRYEGGGQVLNEVLCADGIVKNGGKSIDGLDGSIINRQLSSQSFISGVLTAILNPKTFLFHAAFLPQFIHESAGHSVLSQFVLLGVLYLLIIGFIDFCWVFLAGFVRGMLVSYQWCFGYFSAACFFASATIVAVMRR